MYVYVCIYTYNIHIHTYEHIAVYWSVLQFVVVCCGIFQCFTHFVATCCSVKDIHSARQEALDCSVKQFAAMRCSALQCVAVRCSVLQLKIAAPQAEKFWVAVWCSVMQCIAVSCSALQCVVFQDSSHSTRWEGLDCRVMQFVAMRDSVLSKKAIFLETRGGNVHSSNESARGWSLREANV